MRMNQVIADIRKNNSISQDEMANKLFVTRQAVSRWENGETTPNIETLKMISKEYDVSLNELLDLPERPICQSCGMDLKNPDDFGTNSDGGVNTEYCKYCFRKGSYTHDRNIDEMIESNLKYLDEYNKEQGLSFTPEQAKTELKQYLSTLKRWK
ncbi:MAG TPA: zinc ribbon domain-containing protein [Clostridia bacterium]|nr:zinc ribbon domain-containing protein [Clostridia bacterium]